MLRWSSTEGEESVEHRCDRLEHIAGVNSADLVDEGVPLQLAAATAGQRNQRKKGRPGDQIFQGWPQGGVIGCEVCDTALQAGDRRDRLAGERRCEGGDPAAELMQLCF
ncbi:MAG: hypothetical protein VKM92_02155 [Cyanobacteriota bacterium]|nr:hypothetical protein [Cyanobacteriota bacterium]